MQLQPVQIESNAEPMPPRAVAFLADAQARIDRWFARPDHKTGFGFIPSDYEQVWGALAAVKREHPDLRRMLEWGSGFGVAAGLGALLGMDAHGIEIDGELIPAANDLLVEHKLRASFAHGSFVPTDFDDDGLTDLDTRTALGEPDAYDELGRDLDDFDLVYAYHWPTEEQLYHELFRRHADYGAILLTWSRDEGSRVYRKVAETE